MNPAVDVPKDETLEQFTARLHARLAAAKAIGEKPVMDATWPFYYSREWIYSEVPNEPR